MIRRKTQHPVTRLQVDDPLALIGPGPPHRRCRLGEIRSHQDVHSGIVVDVVIGLVEHVEGVKSAGQWMAGIGERESLSLIEMNRGVGNA